MSQVVVERVLGRLVTDVAFRAEFFEQPTEVCGGHGLELTPVELSALSRVDEKAVRLLAKSLDPRIVRAMSERLPQRGAPLKPSQKHRDRRAKRGTG